MNEDAFARRFYADRAELEALGIHLAVDKPVDGVAEQENYSLPPGELLPAARSRSPTTSSRRCSTALSLLDGEFAYAEPLRLALQQISWGRPSPLRAPEQRGARARASPASAGGHELSQRLAKIETAIFRRKTITFDYYSMERDEVGRRARSTPTTLLFQGGQFYLLGHAHERDALRVFRLSRIRGKVAYATKAEHDFQRPEDFDPRVYANRADWQFGDAVGKRRDPDLATRIAWQVERHFGALRRRRRRDGVSSRPSTPTRGRSLSWVLGLGEHARVLGPARAGRARSPSASSGCSSATRASPTPGPSCRPVGGARRQAGRANGGGRGARRRSAPSASRAWSRWRRSSSTPGATAATCAVADVRERLQISDQELREDVNVLNVVNFGAGSYVLYAELTADGRIEVDPEPYSDHFARPARLLPVEAKALVAGDRPHRRPPPERLARARRARRSSPRSAQDPAREGLQVASAARRRL